jgi:hypothetical protein
MRLRFSYATFVTLGSVAGVEAFISPLSTRSRAASVQVSVGSWDNDNFLDNLSPPKDSDDEIKDSSKDWEEQLREQGTSRRNIETEDEAQGGSRFKQMMNTSQKPEERQSRPIENPFLAPPQRQPTSPDNLSVEEQARMFREMMQRDQSGISQNPVPYQAPPQATKQKNKMGRNRDADTISNTSDLYMAQLKRDSTVRTSAWYQGDLEKASSVFQDEGISELKDLLYSNPYLQE